MSFNWNPTPNPPVREMPQAVPPGEVTYEVKLVANSVNYGGTVRYNTANRSYDIVYEFPSLNVVNGVFENGFFESANIGQATINVANIGQATINTANITNATITFGYTTGSPTSNMGIATKFYVDNAVASISGGAGPDSTANLFAATGDLLVGFAPNTAQRFAVGADGEQLTVKNSANLKVEWKSSSGTQDVGGLQLGTHWHPTLKFSQILLQRVNSITMNDGDVVTGWDGLTANLASSGAGGRDSNSAVAANTWYSVWAIRNSTSGEKALLLHRTLNYVLDTHYTPDTFGFAGPIYLRYGSAALTNPNQRYIEKVSQSFRPNTSSKVKYIQLAVASQSTPRGSLWVTIQGDDGHGNADGTIHGTTQTNSSDTSASGGPCAMTFVFETAVSVTSGSKYLMVIEGDWEYRSGVSDSNMVAIYANTPNPLGPGQQQWMANVGYNTGGTTYLPYSIDPATSSTMGYGDCRCWNVATGTWATASNTASSFPVGTDLWFKIYMEENNTALALPVGYNQYSLISYACTNGASEFKEYHQLERTMSMGYDNDWLAYRGTPAGIWGQQWSGIAAVDLRNFVPPVPCSVQFTGVQQDVNSQGLVLGIRTMYAMYFVAAYESAGTSGNPLGTYGMGGFFMNHSTLSKVMPLDGIPVINHRNFSSYPAILHVANITF